MKKTTAALLVLLVLCLGMPAQAVPYESYTYSAYSRTLPLPAPYVPTQGITGSMLGLDAFAAPTDLFVTDDGMMYLSDTNNNRIVIFDKTLQHVQVISAFDTENGTESFSKPQGVYVADGVLYVCDTGNNRLVALMQTESGWRTHYVIQNPQSVLFPENFVFAPLRVAVDDANRVYLLGRNVLEGIMVFDADQEFMGYFGTIHVTVSVADWFWRQFATLEQRSKQVLFVPTEFTGLDIDCDGFVFTTEINSENDEPIKRINPAGKNVIKNYSGIPISGDLVLTEVASISGSSEFKDIVAWDNGCYSAVDGKRGRIFTYDEEGNLLYVFGGMGTEFGMLTRPTAIEKHDDTLYVLDQARGMLLAFEPTQFGRAVNSAVDAWHRGDDVDSMAGWEQVLELCGHYEKAYAGLGKAYLNNGDNKTAMEYLERGSDRRYYSVALKRYRSEQIKLYFVPAICTLAGAAGLMLLVKVLRRRRVRNG